MNEDDPNQEDDEKDLITTFYYDRRGNLIGTTDAEGNKISHKYDGFDRKTLTTRYLKNGEKIETGFTYYDNHLLKTIEDDKGNITEYKYDDQKRLKQIIYPDTSFIEVTYTKTTKDEQDYKRVIIKQRNGIIVTNDYDKSGRLVNRTIQKSEDVEGTTFENFAYDGLNRLNYAENDNFVVEFKFDPLNRITEEKQMGKLLNYTYSVVDNLRRMTMKYPNDRLIEKNFDLLDRLSNIKQGDNEIANFKYIGRSYRLLSKQFGNGDAVNYLYDQGRRMTSKEAKNKNSDLINKYVYGYNKVHMKNYEQRMHENGIGDVFGYDAVYRLTKAQFNVPDPTVENPTDFERERKIFLDHVDNITRIDETKNGETSQITTEIPPDTDYFKLNQYSRFDQWGLSYDKNGNLTQKGTQKMYFDFRNQMVRVTDESTTTENKYDALGRRLQKIVTTGSQAKTENYYYSGHLVIEVRDSNDQVKRQFIYGNGIDEVIRMDAYNGSDITPYYFHRNEVGSTTAVTDANGEVVERYKYGLFGIPNSSIGNNILFQGREYEPETNFYYFRFRDLDPIMGRFLQTDPMGYEDSLNLYQGFGMNPVNFTDPFGESLREILKVQYAYFVYLRDVEGWSEAEAQKEAKEQAQILRERWEMSLEVKKALKELCKENFRKRLYSGAPVGDLNELQPIFDYIKNFGSRTGEAISNWLMHKDFEHFLIMATTAWGEAGEAFLAVLGGLKGYQTLKAQIPAIQRLEFRFEAFVKGKYGQYKDWYNINKPRLIRGSIGLTKIEERLQKVVGKYGGVKVEGGYKFPNKRSAKQAASELAGNLGNKVENLYVKDYGGVPWNLRKSNKIHGKMSADRSKGWRDDFLGHKNIGENRPHINVWIDGYKWNFYY